MINKIWVRVRVRMNEITLAHDHKRNILTFYGIFQFKYAQRYKPMQVKECLL